ncbi:MAG TPA: hypothetical protein VN782_14260 [Usitatibacter sp.]|jgi:hypothetical protein|nr:hypothetical protein [Usitatibacter sp.]
MWTRRVLLATLVAAAAMSLPRHAPSAWGSAFAASNVTVSSLR